VGSSHSIEGLKTPEASALQEITTGAAMRISQQAVSTNTWTISLDRHLPRQRYPICGKISHLIRAVKQVTDVVRSPPHKHLSTLFKATPSPRTPYLPTSAHLHLRHPHLQHLYLQHLQHPRGPTSEPVSASCQMTGSLGSRRSTRSMTNSMCLHTRRRRARSGLRVRRGVDARRGVVRAAGAAGCGCQEGRGQGCGCGGVWMPGGAWSGLRVRRGVDARRGVVRAGQGGVWMPVGAWSGQGRARCGCHGGHGQGRARRNVDARGERGQGRAGRGVNASAARIWQQTLAKEDCVRQRQHS